MVNAWNVGELDQMVLPPCHYGFQVYTRELSDVERYSIARQYGLCPKYSNIGIENCTKEEHYNKYNVPTRAISLMWNQRSVDTLLGLPFNIASYGLLLEIIAREVNMVPDELIGNLGDTHLYSNHIEQAKEQITREPMKLPTLKIMDYDSGLSITRNREHWEPIDFVVENYESHPAIKAPLSN
jgi:thymidylate synthase